MFTIDTHQRHLKSKVRELTILESVARSVATNSTSEDALFNQIVEASVSLTKADRGLLLLFDKENSELHLRAGKNLGQARTKLLRRKVDDNLLGQSMLSGEPILLVGEKKLSIEIVPGYFVESLLQAPLVIQDEVVGLLAVYTHTNQRSFSKDDLNRLLDIASYATIALQNAKQYELLTEAQDRLLAAEAVAWLGIIGSNLAHTVVQKTSAIQKYLVVLENYLLEDEARKLLAKLNQAVVAIENVPILKELPTSMEMVGPLRIDRTLTIVVNEQVRSRSDVTVKFNLHCPGVQVRIDLGWLNAVIEKLINNSLRAMPDGGELKITSTIEGKWVNIDFIDTGHGVPQEHLSYLFKRHVPKKEGEIGNGVGILIAQYIIHYHGGDLKLLWSKSGRGTALRITLPIAENK